jgi:CMP-2-keto-3-deoxyoctulosonic acid synthetase
MKVAIIPARGGSKRIPKKNIRSFSGKPLISYAIKAVVFDFDGGLVFIEHGRIHVKLFRDNIESWALETAL